MRHMSSDILIERYFCVETSAICMLYSIGFEYIWDTFFFKENYFDFSMKMNLTHYLLKLEKY